MTIGLWALAEAIVWPIVADVGLCLLVLAAPRQALRLFGAVVSGALVGSLVLAVWTSQAPDAVEATLLSVPGIDSAMLAATDESLVEYGVMGFAQVGPGAPLKAYCYAWVRRGGDLAGLVAGAILNRLTRIGPTVLVAAALGWLLGGWLRQRARLTLTTYGLLWITFYAIYLS